MSTVFVLIHHVNVFVIMSKRVTIVLDDDLVKKLRIIQSKKIANQEKLSVFQEQLTMNLERLSNRGIIHE